MRQLNDEKVSSIIEKVLPISLVTDDTIVNVFYNKDDEVEYSLYTDGNIEHLDTWLDDKPHQRDFFLMGCGRLRRLEFKITDAKVLLIEKKRGNNIVKNLYIDEENTFKIIVSNIYKVSATDSGKVKIKRMVDTNAD